MEGVVIADDILKRLCSTDLVVWGLGALEASSLGVGGGGLLRPLVWGGGGLLRPLVCQF